MGLKVRTGRTLNDLADMLNSRYSPINKRYVVVNDNILRLGHSIVTIL